MDRLMRFVVGAAAGAVAALLLSPKSGREWRRLFLERLREYLRAGAGEDVQTAPAVETRAQGPNEEAGAAAVDHVGEESARLVPPVPAAAHPLGREEAEMAPVMQPPPAAAVADLRAKVEETRQAVREALDRPFDAGLAGQEGAGQAGAPGSMGSASVEELSELAQTSAGGREESPHLATSAQEERLPTETSGFAEEVVGLAPAAEVEPPLGQAPEEPLWPAADSGGAVSAAPVVEEAETAVSAKAEETLHLRPEDVRVWPAPEEAFTTPEWTVVSPAGEEPSAAEAAAEAEVAAIESPLAEPEAGVQSAEVQEAVPAEAESPQGAGRLTGAEGWQPTGERVSQGWGVEEAGQQSAEDAVRRVPETVGEPAAGPHLEAVIGGSPPTSPGAGGGPTAAESSPADMSGVSQAVAAPPAESREEPGGWQLVDAQQAVDQTSASAPFGPDTRDSGEITEDLGSPALMDQAEMRRRIEETRTRLKAKAFDAMTSGEAALLSRSGGETPVLTDDAGLDADVERALDRSFAPDDS